MQKRNLSVCYSLGLVALLSLGLSGCGILPDFMRPDHKMTVNLKASSDINPDAKHHYKDKDQARPLTIMIYELKNDEVFKNASFFTIYQNPTQVLGEDLLGQERVYLKPGDKFAVRFTVKRETKYLGIIAAYSQIDEAKWRVVIPLTSSWGAESKWIDVKRLELVVQK